MSPVSFVRWLVPALVLLAVACRADDDPGVGSGTGAAGSASTPPGTDLASCEGIARAQPSTGPCCPAYGADACGSNGFCAAFDGRTTPVCYLEYSRPDRSACSDDIQCASHACNLDEGKCKSLASFACDPAIGCSSYGVTGKFGCDPSTKKCRDLSNGQVGDICEADSCADGLTCTKGRCKGKIGSPCVADEGCLSGLCGGGGISVCLECARNADCPEGEYCAYDAKDTRVLRCFAACGAGVLCPKYYTCVPAATLGTGIDQCVHNAKCKTTADCAKGSTCQTGPSCKPGGLCDEPTVCLEN